MIATLIFIKIPQKIIHFEFIDIDLYGKNNNLFKYSLSNTMLRKILSIFLFFCSLSILSQNKNLMFYSLTMRDGLSNNEVNTVFKDSKGFLWVGTKSGLNKFDGYQFIIFKNENENTSSISSDNIFTITEDLKGQLWVGTNAGLNKFNRETESFERYDLEELNTEQSFNNRTHYLFVDNKGVLWIGYENGLELLDTKTGKRLQSNDIYKLKVLLNGKSVNFIFQDNDENIWIGTWFGGLIRVDQKLKKINQYINEPSNVNSLPNNTIKAISQDSNGRLWIGTYGGGLCYYNQNEDSFVKVNNPLINKEISAIITLDKTKIWVTQSHSIAEINSKNNSVEYLYTYDPTNPLSFTESTTNNIYKDNSGIVWISTNRGVSYYDPNRDRFSSHFIPFVTKNKKVNYVKSFLFDKQNNAFIGTFGSGVFYFDNTLGDISQLILPNANDLSNITSSIIRHKNGDIWIGTSNGIYIIDEVSKKSKNHLMHSETNANTIYHNNIQRIFQDSRGWVWIVTQESLDLLVDTKFYHFTKSKLNGISNYKITDIVEDKEGNVWIGTFYGLNKFDWKKRKISKYFSQMSNKNGLLSSEILCVFVDSKEKVWVGSGKGLSTFEEKDNQFKHFDLGPENENEVVYRVAEDKEGNLWFICSSGVLKYDRNNHISKKYDHNDGLNSNYETIDIDKQGNIYIGGKTNGFYKFNNKSIKENLLPPPVYVTNLLLFNKQVQIDKDKNKSVLQKSILYTDKITLKYDQTVLGFEFAALNFTLPMKNQYAYKLVGFDKNWNYVDANKRFVSYTNLKSGQYTLLVKASNNDGVWTKNAAKINIEVLPPFWRTNFAYFTYFVIIILLLYLYRHFMLKRYHEKTEIALERIESEKKHEMDQMKLRFFTNISHEFRTPLTLIAGPLSKLIAESRDAGNEKLTSQYNLMHRNTQRLILLINQLLDLQKSETGNLNLNQSYGDIISFLNSLFARFITIAEQNEIDYHFSTSIDILKIKFDADKIEKIVFNLLSNAFKFTKTHVIFNVKTNDDFLVFEIEDDGIGLPAKEINKIFDHFYQVDNSKTRRAEGSGVGLALTRELVALHNGRIEVKSELGKGATFIISIPLLVTNKSQDSELEINNYSATEQYSYENNKIDNLISTAQLTNSEKTKPLVLIVEDNTDLRQYIRETLDYNYKILEAENGRNGFNSAVEFLPDLIISDIMMPEIDGVELCSILKSDMRTSHIPIILLTALSSNESKLSGVKSGADDYIVKPFNESLLLARIENLIENRKLMQLKFQQTLHIDPNELGTNTPDEKLIKKAVELIEQNIENPEFNIQQLVNELNISRRGVYSKVKAMTGMSVSDFIKSIRLRRAAQLLITKEFTISEVYYKVGFQNRTHFNDSFKKQFSMTPSDFIKKHAVE